MELEDYMELVHKYELKMDQIREIIEDYDSDVDDGMMPFVAAMGAVYAIRTVVK